MHHLSHAALGFAAAIAAVCTGCANAESAPARAAVPPAASPQTAIGRAAPNAPNDRPTHAAFVSETAEAVLGSGEPGNDDDVELVVDREVVAHCPALRLVRTHLDEFDPDMMWLAVLQSIGDCMRQGGPMENDVLGVSGTAEHRHVVRQVLASRGVAPIRVFAPYLAPTAPAEGAAECQGGGADCTASGRPDARRVQISLASVP